MSPEAPEQQPATSAEQVEVAAPQPAPARPRRAPTVTAFGRVWPRADWMERCFWGGLWVSCLAALALAAFVLRPDPSGIGTHQQLGLPPCGFVEMFGGPCPSCGFTTTWTLAAHLRPVDALVNQPFGMLLFCLSLGALLALPLSVFRGISLMALTERWPWWRLGLTLAGLWLLAWGYKWGQTVGW